MVIKRARRVSAWPFCLGFQESAIGEIGFVDVGFGDDFHRGVHGQDRNPGVQDIHVVVAQDIGDGSASSGVDLADFGGLVMDGILIHRVADEGEVFRERVVAATLPAGPGVFIEDDALAEIAGVVGLVDGGIKGIDRAGDVARKHIGVAHRVTDGKVAVFPF